MCRYKFSHSWTTVTETNDHFRSKKSSGQIDASLPVRLLQRFRFASGNEENWTSFGNAGSVNGISSEPRSICYKVGDQAVASSESCKTRLLGDLGIKRGTAFSTAVVHGTRRSGITSRIYTRADPMPRKGWTPQQPPVSMEILSVCLRNQLIV